MPDPLRLNAAMIAALYALRGTVRRSNDLEVQALSGSGGLLVQHPDGRAWRIDRGGATTPVAGPRLSPIRATS